MDLQLAIWVILSKINPSCYLQDFRLMCRVCIANRGDFADVCSVNFQFAHVCAQSKRLCYITGNLGKISNFHGYNLLFL